MGRIFCAAPEWIYTRMERSSGCARPPRLNSVFPNDAEQAGPGLRRACQASPQGEERPISLGEAGPQEKVSSSSRCANRTGQAGSFAPADSRRML